MCHQDIGLLHHLCLLDAFSAEEKVRADRTLWRDFLDHEGLELMEPGELFVYVGVRVVPVDQRIGQLEPAMPFVRVVVVRDDARGAAKVPAGHDVRERVVIDRLVILVGSDHPEDVR